MRPGTIRLDRLSRLYAQLGLQPIDVLLRDREIRFGPVEVEDFPQQRQRSAIDWLQGERELDATLEESEAMSLREVARMLGVRVNLLQERLPGISKNCVNAHGDE